MYRFPELSTTTPFGPHKGELVAGPAMSNPVVPLPATTVNCPAGVTFSTTLLPVSAMYRFPELSTVALLGLRNAVLVAGPAVGVPVQNVLVPATPDSVPDGVTLYISLFV